MDEWHVGDPADWGDSVGVPDMPYMGYLQEDEEEQQNTPRTSHERDEAWRLREDGNPELALVKINAALRHDKGWRNYNVKAIILEDLNDFDGAIECYDTAMSKTSSQLVRNNKARLLERLSSRERYSENFDKALALINEALKLTADDDDRKSFLFLKTDILELMNRPGEAYVCCKLANKQFDLVDRYESQSRFIRDSKKTLICIAGKDFHGPTPIPENSTVDLIKEGENVFDRDAIRVELNGKMIGYVANSQRTLVGGVKSATQIKGRFQNKAKAKVLFKYMERYFICELMEDD